MSFGNILKNFDLNQRSLVKVYFAVGIPIILGLLSYYIYGFQKQATEEAKIVPNLVSRYMYYAGSDNFETLLIDYILLEVIAKLDYPIIVTDSEMTPFFWRKIGIPEGINWNDLTPQQQATIQRRLEKMKEKDHQIPLLHSSDDEIVLGYTFYEDTEVIKRLKVLPFIEVFLILVFLLFGLYALSIIKRNEKRRIWVGLAKETAHQFGTPISSLIGWIDLFKLKAENSRQRDDFYSMLDDMSSDVELLKKVASRFGKVGSNIKLQSTNIDDMIYQCVDYFRKRLPHFNNEINIKYIAECPNVNMMLDEELFTWALENIIKNAIDSMKQRQGTILITSKCTGDKYLIQIADQGVGMPRSMYKKVFEPGITTKERGWGLGLSLAKRIIEEYHYGKIRVLESVIDIGTTIEIEMRAKAVVSE